MKAQSQEIRCLSAQVQEQQEAIKTLTEFMQVSHSVGLIVAS